MIDAILHGLAIFYVTYVLVNLDGLGKVFVSLRNASAVPSQIREGLQCFWCTSFWVGAIIAIAEYRNGIAIISTLAAIAIANVVNRYLESR